MKIITDYPPNWEKIKDNFPVENAEVVMCYGDTIYNPFKLPVRDDLHYHESVHMKQQGDDPEGWWDRYMKDGQFRIQMEADAYGAQLRYIKDVAGERYYLKALASFSDFLSGPVYGNSITKLKAFDMIRRASKKNL